MPSGITFAFASSDINAQFYPVLDQVASTLGSYDQTTVNVIGHTDSVGADAYNQKLSERRAHSVTDYLVEGGIPRNSFVSVQGAGETQPVADNATADGRSMNRRVEIRIER